MPYRLAISQPSASFEVDWIPAYSRSRSRERRRNDAIARHPGADRARQGAIGTRPGPMHLATWLSIDDVR